MGLTDDLVAAYEEGDSATRAERAERAAWIARLGWPREGWFFFGGHGVINPWDEVRRTFINGEYVATVLCGHAFLEHLLAGLLESQEGGAAKRAGLSEILRRVRDYGWITKLDYDILDGVRRMRNPYAHYRNFDHPESLVNRAVVEKESADVLLERDARAVVESLLHLVNRPPFALGPIVYPEDGGPFLHPEQTQLPM